MGLRIKLCLLTVLLVASGVQAQYIPRFDVQGHRGARGLKPENTISAFLAALDLGVTTVELDVVISKDKQVVVSHEPWMAAQICTDTKLQPIAIDKQRAYNIYRMTYDSIRRFDCGSKPSALFPQQESKTSPKPLLRDVMIAVENHIKNYSRYEVDYSIEIKYVAAEAGIFHPSVEEFSDLVYNEIDQYLPLNRVVIQCADVQVLQYWNKKYPDVRLSLLVENVLSCNQNLHLLGFNPSIYSPSYKLLTQEAINELHKRKIRVIPWTVNETSEILRLRSMGVDGVITDYPDRALSIGLGVKGTVGKRAAAKK